MDSEMYELAKPSKACTISQINRIRAHFSSSWNCFGIITLSITVLYKYG